MKKLFLTLMLTTPAVAQPYPPSWTNDIYDPSQFGPPFNQWPASNNVPKAVPFDPSIKPNTFPIPKNLQKALPFDPNIRANVLPTPDAPNALPFNSSIADKK